MSHYLFILGRDCKLRIPALPKYQNGSPIITSGGTVFTLSETVLYKFDISARRWVRIGRIPQATSTDNLVRHDGTQFRDHVGKKLAKFADIPSDRRPFLDHQPVLGRD